MFFKQNKVLLFFISKVIYKTNLNTITFRWLTTAIRLLMMYTRSEKPSDTLVRLVTYIQRIYGPVWFVVKRQVSFVRGPVILFSIIEEVKQMENSESLAEVVFPIIQRNAFCCLPENFLASLVYSEEASSRSMGVKHILKIRSEGNKDLLPNTVPVLNFQAEDWTGLIDVPSACYEPPVTKILTVEELEDLVVNPLEPPRIPIHSQSVERAVKMVSDASKLAHSYQKRHECIVATAASREKRKAFTSKGKYVIK
jgi:hypothetical protein